MNPIHAFLIAALAATTLAACDREDAREAANEARRDVARASDKIEGALERTQDKLVDAAGQVKATVTTGANTALEATGADGKTSAILGDATITASVKAALVKDPDLSALAIDVDTSNGVVTLAGTASTDAARTRAGQLASATRGVREVRNNLTVGRG
jgi:hyperosmotically inducible protein